MLTRDHLRADIYDRVFRLAEDPAQPSPPPPLPGGGAGSLDDPGHESPADEPFPRLDPPPPPPRRIGVEAELIPLGGDGRALPIAATLSWARAHAERHGWTEDAGAAVPRFLLPDGAVLFFEPGGQLEYASAPHFGPSALLAALRSAVGALRDSAADAGVSLAGVGIAPGEEVDAVPLQLRSERYLRMDRYLAQWAPAGARMMRQTASCQVNLDFPSDPLLAWRLTNAAAPYLTAMFANSPVYAGRATGHRSYRAHTWRALDPGRTGLLRAPLEPDAAVEEYLEFALGALWFLTEPSGGRWAPFGERLRLLDHAAWLAHLTTLFPEVRPRGYLEVRSPDALPPHALPAPLVLLTGLLHHRHSLEAAVERLGPPDPELLRRGGEVGLAHPELASGAAALVRLGLEGAEALGPLTVQPTDLAAAAAFFEAYTLRGRAPADDHPLAAGAA